MNNLKTNYNLSKNSWFGLGGKADKFFTPNDENELTNYIKKNTNEKYCFIGSGSNILFRDKGCKKTIIKLGKNFRNINIKNNKIICGSAVLKNQLSKFALDNEIINYEFLSCIPGTIGGGVTMNAGCFQNEFKDIIEEVKGFNKKTLKFVRYKKSEIKFSYRKTDLPDDLIVTEVVFQVKYGSKEKIKDKINFFKKKKKAAQPSKIKTGGSTFKNPDSKIKAWELIQKSGCDRIKFGKAKFSKMHCNFIENQGNSSLDIEKLIYFTIDEVKKKFNIVLEPEIKIIGEK
ncbi:MAG: UDP-N-acetylenolpyruvoylglucosamine reductase [Pelagibacteraceae bacterium]|nr:UDP-N-acetylenolpyruvoylglucosamine reductase [Pelagibacteraceae bacterium]OUV89333.1 MAG: UDP-N-acetylenolpyruvoylglucosamine reductase [Pelagibacteraceae bacterium TMED146]RZO93169.1 MAG: UDP-N-acetylmuramate dehydrogenase [alpha proteobacterium HIMB114]|tara:strand:- start:29521 stop:30384 length:864 start_codon:yes stop_codon:yes gene_type:complete